MIILALTSIGMSEQKNVRLLLAAGAVSVAVLWTLRSRRQAIADDQCAAGRSSECDTTGILHASDMQSSLSESTLPACSPPLKVDSYLASEGTDEQPNHAYESKKDPKVATLDASPSEAAATAARHALDDALSSSLSQDTSSPLIPRAASTDSIRRLEVWRDVAAGEVLLRLKPEATAPRWPHQRSEDLSTAEIATCQQDAGGSLRVGALAEAGQRLQGTKRADDGSTSTKAAKGVDATEEELTWLAAEVEALWLLAVRVGLLGSSLLEAALCLEDHVADRPPAARSLLLHAGRRLSAALAAGARVALCADDATRLLGVLLTNAFGLRDAGGKVGRRIDSSARGFALCTVRARTLPPALLHSSALVCIEAPPHRRPPALATRQSPEAALGRRLSEC